MTIYRVRLKLPLLLASCLMVVVCTSQNRISTTQPVSILDYRSGLLNQENFFAYTDSRNLVWIASGSGLFRFDGDQLDVLHPEKEFHENFNPNAIHSFFVEDSDDNLWFGTWNGVNKYIRSTGQFESFKPVSAETRHRYFVAGIDSSQLIWFTHSDSIYTIDSRSGDIQARAPFSSWFWNSEIQLDSTGHVSRIYSYNRYRSYPGLFIHEFDENQFRRSSAWLTDAPLDTIAVTDVEVLSETSVYVTTSQGLYHLNPVSGQLTHIDLGNTGPELYINAVCSSNGTELILGTRHHDYLTYDLVNQTVSDKFCLESQGERIQQAPVTMSIDRNGGIWIYLEGRGMAFFHPSKSVFTHYLLSTGDSDLPVSIKAGFLHEMQNSDVLATTHNKGGYILHVDNGNFNGQITRCVGCPTRIKSSVYDSQGRIWFSDDHRVSVLDSTGQLKTVGLPQGVSNISGIKEIQNGQIVLVAGGMIHMLEQSDLSDYHFVPIRLEDTTMIFYSLVNHSDNVILAYAVHRDKGSLHLLELDPNNGFNIKRTQTVSYYVNSFYSDPESDVILLTTKAALYSYTITSGTIDTILSSEQLSHFELWGVLPQTDSTLLLCGGTGVLRYNRASGRITRYGPSHGLGSGSITWHGFLQHSSGKAWLAHSEGISIQNDVNTLAPSPETPVNITGIRIDDLEITDRNGTEINPTEPKGLVLRPGSRSLTIDFAALEYLWPNYNSYEYRLVGYEDQWVTSEPFGFVRYANLPPGEMQFQARVKDRPGTITTLEVSVVAPLYARPWFILLVVAFSITMVVLVIREISLRKQRKITLEYQKRLAVETERLRISNNIHDDLGSGLSALTLKTRLLLAKSKDSAINKQLLDLQHNAEHLARTARDTIWITNTKNDSLESLLTQLHEYTSEYFQDTHIEYRVALPENIPSHNVAGEIRRQVYLAYKEALHNVLKHADASSVAITIEHPTSRSVSILVHDDGKGFDPNAINEHGQGIQSMKQRMEGIQGNCIIESSPSGTTATLDFKLS